MCASCALGVFAGMDGGRALRDARHCSSSSVLS